MSQTKYICNNATCGKSMEYNKICSRCRTVHYCNVECQKADWDNHKKSCKERTGEMHNIIKDFVQTSCEKSLGRSLFMFLCKFQKDESDKKYVFHINTNLEDFKTLVKKMQEKITLDDENVKWCQTMISKLLSSMISYDEIPDEERLVVEQSDKNICISNNTTRENILQFKICTDGECVSFGVGILYARN